jgi:hypothetical protein
MGRPQDAEHPGTLIGTTMISTPATLSACSSVVSGFHSH